MSAKIYFVGLCLVLGCAAQTTPDIEDFDDQRIHADFEFLFHDDYDLVVVIHENNCYYYGLTDQAEIHLSTNAQRHQFERNLANIIRHDRDHYIKQSSLGQMRTTYEDLLADFLCTDRDGVFSIEIPTAEVENVLYTHHTAAPTTTTSDPLDYLLANHPTQTSHPHTAQPTTTVKPTTMDPVEFLLTDHPLVTDYPHTARPTTTLDPLEFLLTNHPPETEHPHTAQPTTPDPVEFLLGDSQRH